jgi:hypothetical protein
MRRGEHLFETRTVGGADRVSQVVILGLAPIHAMLSTRHGRRSVRNINKIADDALIFLTGESAPAPQSRNSPGPRSVRRPRMPLGDLTTPQDQHPAGELRDKNQLLTFRCFKNRHQTERQSRSAFPRECAAGFPWCLCGIDRWCGGQC